MVQKLASGMVAVLPFVLGDPAPQVWIEGFGESPVELRVTAWVKPSNGSTGSTIAAY